jgi:sugar lactone lactonase YvrE
MPSTAFRDEHNQQPATPCWGLAPTILLLFTFLASALVSPASGQEYTFENFAGTTGGAGWYDGAGSAARLANPAAIAADAAGNLYIADRTNHTIRRVSPAGVVTTIAGLAGESGSADGPRHMARFNTPNGIALDALGNIYVADSLNHTIRKITATGFVSTVAGTPGVEGIADGIGSAAQFKRPGGVAFSPSGHLYVLDRDHSRLRRIGPDRKVETVRNSFGSIVSVSLGDLAIGSDGTLYFTKTLLHTVWKLSPDGVLSLLAGEDLVSGEADGSGAAARFEEPFGIAFGPDGSLYVADTGNRTIRKIDSAGTVTTVAGLADYYGHVDGTLAAARFTSPFDLVPVGGDLVILDNQTVRRITSQAVTTIAGAHASSGSADGLGEAARFALPSGLTTDAAGNVYVADLGNNKIRKITPAGEVTTVAGTGELSYQDGPALSAKFSNPSGVAFDSLGRLVIADRWNSLLRTIDSDLIVRTLAGRPYGATEGTYLNSPHAITRAPSGLLYFTESSAVRAVTVDGTVTTVPGYNTPNGSPRGIAFDAAGNLYVADTMNNAIRLVTPSGTLSLFAGSGPGYSGYEDGSGSGAFFSRPHGLAMYSQRLFVADWGNSTLRAVTMSGDVTTFAGRPYLQGNVAGTANGARFSRPESLAFDGSGNLYVADSSSQNIRVGRPTALQDRASAGSGMTCVGVPISLGTSASGANSWSWALVRRESDSQSELSSSTIPGPTFTPDREGLYTFLLRAEGAAGVRYSTVNVHANGCCGYPGHSGTISATGPTTVCASEHGGTAVVASNAAGIVSRQWGWRETPGGQIFSISGADGETYQIRGSDFGGVGQRYLVCTITACDLSTVSNEIPVVILPSPTATISAAASVSAHSTGNVASASDAGAGATYSWSITNGSITSPATGRQITWTAGALGLPTKLSASVTLAGCTITVTHTVQLVSHVDERASFYTVPPCRIIDTRTPGDQPLAAGASRNVPVSGRCGIPWYAKSVSLNVTVVEPPTRGHLTLYPRGYPRPLASTINYGAGRTRANNAVIRIGNGDLTVASGGGATHFIIDVNGYFQ